MQVMVLHYLVGELLPSMRADDLEVELILTTEDGRFDGDIDRLDALFKFYPAGRFSHVWGTAAPCDIILGAPRLK